MKVMKQTAVEWLIGQLYAPCRGIPSHIIEQAKAMHKEEIENAVKQGWDYNEEGLVQWMGEKYYNETFNDNEK